MYNTAGVGLIDPLILQIQRQLAHDELARAGPQLLAVTPDYGERRLPLRVGLSSGLGVEPIDLSYYSRPQNHSEMLQVALGGAEHHRGSRCLWPTIRHNHRH